MANSSLPDRSRLDSALSDLRSEVDGLNRRQLCALFVACAEGLFPFYEGFAQATGWGNPAGLRVAAESAWGYAEGGAALNESGPSLLTLIEDATPDGEKFDAPGSTLAQDVAICLDAAVRGAMLTENPNSAWVQYALEPATILACSEQTGFLDPGTSTRAQEWRSQAIEHPRLRKAIDSLERMISLLMSMGQVTRRDRESLVNLATGLRE